MGKTGKPGMLQSMGSQRAGHDWTQHPITKQYPITVTFFYLSPRFMKTLKCFLSLEICLFWALCISCYQFVWVWNPMDCSTPGFPILTTSQSLLRLRYIESVMPSNHLVLCCPLLLLPSFFPNIRVFCNDSALPIRWPKYRSFSFSISPSNEYSGLISFRMDWLDLFAIQGTPKSLLHHCNSKASILQHSAFFIVQLSHPYMTTGKIMALTISTFAGKVMSLLF